MTIQTALQQFIDVEMPSRNYKPLTERTYSYDIKEFLQNIGKTNAEDIDLHAVKLYQAEFEKRGISDATKHRKTMAIKAFIIYLEKEEIIKNCFSSRISIPDIPPTEPRALTEKEYKAVLDAANGNLRDRAMLEVLLQTGIRLSELTGLTMDDIDLPVKPSPDQTTGFGMIRVKRKRGRVQELPLNYKACRVVKAYLRVRPTTGSNYLFLTKYQTQMTNRSVQKAFKKYAVEANVPWAHVHTFRTTNITHHFAKKTPITVIQKNAGHENIATTNRYAAFVKDIDIKAMQENAL